MNDSKQIRVLSGFVPFLRLLNAYVSDNFRQSGWRRILESIFYAMCASVMITSLPFVGCSIVWLLIENDMEWIKCVVAVPLLFSLVQMVLTCVAMMIKNRSINVMIDQLQRVVDARESLISLIFLIFGPSFILISFIYIRKLVRLHGF